jgi:hypothetical protein
VLAALVAVVGTACSDSSDPEQSGSTTTQEPAPVDIPILDRDGEDSGDSGGSTTSESPGDESKVPEDEALPVAGVWEGTYECNQGTTGLRLTIEDDGAGGLTGIFDFFAVPENPRVPSGSFNLIGSYADGELELLGAEWIERPGNYITVDLHAVAAGIGPDHMTGTVAPSDGSSGCSTFTVDRV